jgi:hypothetical protein
MIYVSAWKDSNEEWRFGIMEDNKACYGTEPGEYGILEPKFRAMLADKFNVPPADIGRIIDLSKLSHSSVTPSI